MQETKLNTVPPSSEGGHHPYSPSKWPALLECAAFKSAPPSADTARGTDLHILFADILLDTWDGDEPTDFLEVHVVEAARKIKYRMAKTDRLYVEERVLIPSSRGCPSGIWGRPDCAWVDRETGDLHVVDLKTAWSPDRDHTAQLAAYAAALLMELAAERKPEPANVHLHLVYADTGEFATHTIPTADLWKMHSQNYEYVVGIYADERAQADMEPRQCGWCALCAAFTTCPAMKVVVEKAGPRIEEASKPERWAALSSLRKAQACALADTLGKWCAAVKELAAADAKAGESIVDVQNGIYYGLQTRSGKWTATPDEAWAVTRGTLTPEQFKDCLSLSAAKLKAKLRGAGKSVKEIEAMLDAVGTRGEPSVVFVRKRLKESA